MSETQPLEQGPPAAVRFFYSRAFKPLFIASLLMYFIFLVLANAPASLAAWGAHKAVPSLWLTSLSGSLWQGRAGGAQVDFGQKAIALGTVRWELSPASLLMLRPCIKFETDTSGLLMSGTVCQSLLGETDVKDVSVDAPVAVINELLPMEASGQLSIQIIRASLLEQSVQSLDGRFSWQNASVDNGETWLTLGAFGGQVEADGAGGVTAQVVDISGPYGVELKAGWTPGSENWQVDGTIAPRDNAMPQVVQALQIVGEETEKGAYKVVWP